MNWLFGKVYKVKLLSRGGKTFHVRGDKARLELQRLDSEFARDKFTNHMGNYYKARAAELHKRIAEGKADPISDREREIAKQIRERHEARFGKKKKFDEKENSEAIDRVLEENRIDMSFSQRLRGLFSK